MKHIDADEMNLDKYLGIKEGILLIPFSQRPYEWSAAHVERLFNDLTSLYGTDNDIHMLNFFTLSGEDDEIKIFDGQQRTITALLLLSVFIRKLDEMNMTKAAEQLQKSHIMDINHLKVPPTETKKLEFVDEEVNNLFSEIVSRGTKKEYNVNDYSNSTKKTLVSNYNLLIKLLDQFIEDNKLDGNDVLALISNILERATLIVIKTSTDELAHSMFETLNNTGKKLENFYVLKNDLIIKLSEEGVRPKWNIIEAKLENYDPSDFLLSFTTIMTGKSAKQNTLNKLYDKFDKNSSEEMNDLLEKMVVASERYLQIRNPAQLQGAKTQKEIIRYKNLSNQISIFSVKQHYPLLLAMLMRKKSTKEINEIMTYILNLVIRNFYFNEKRANTIEKPIAELAKRVYNDDISQSDIKSQISAMTIDNENLKLLIRQKEVSSSEAKRRLKFILREAYNTCDFDKEVEIKSNLDEIHYEHILPQKPNEKSKWLEDFPNEDERKKYTKKIGNATLLLNKLNVNIGNKDFNYKKDEYKKSNIPENVEISKRSKWTKTSIDKRTDTLGEKIIAYLERLIVS